MSVVCVVQARMGSSRLPGKVLADVGGQPMLALMLRRLAAGRTGSVVVATSTAAADDPVAGLADSLGVQVVRGSEPDVLARFADVVRAMPSASTVVRLTADCPLADPELVATAVAHHLAVGADYTSNTLVRTYPDGLDVEVLRPEMILQAEGEATDAAEREHVTPFFYRRPGRYRLEAIRHDDALGDERWTIDTEDDLAWLRGTVARLPDPLGAGWESILAVVGRTRAPAPGQLHLRPAIASTPAARVWELCRDGRPLGSLRLPVSNGVGTLEVSVPDELLPNALDLLRSALRADYQVRDLVLPRS